MGEITVGGSIGLALFGGLAAGILGAGAYLVLRPFTPAPAGPTGLLGVADPLSPDNVDFEILGPTWLALASLLGTAALFGATLGALAGRFTEAATVGRVAAGALVVLAGIATAAAAVSIAS